MSGHAELGGLSALHCYQNAFSKCFYRGYTRLTECRHLISFVILPRRITLAQLYQVLTFSKANCEGRGTAIFSQNYVIFNKKLSKVQWLSLIILTGGCMLKQVNFTKEGAPLDAKVQKSSSVGFSINAIFIFVQIFCSCLAGVYNEYLLKKQGADVNIFVQNVFMYLDSIVCNVLLLTLQGDLGTAFAYDSLTKVFHYKVLIVMVNNTAIGIVTSFFLKTLNSILKTFASALELVLTAVFSYLLFGIPIYLNTALSLATVMYAVYLYSKNPVSNVVRAKQTSDDQIELLKTEEV